MKTQHVENEVKNEIFERLIGSKATDNTLKKGLLGNHDSTNES